MRVGIDGCLANLLEEFEETGIAGKIGSDANRIQEEADQAFDLGSNAASDRRSDGGRSASCPGVSFLRMSRAALNHSSRLCGVASRACAAVSREEEEAVP